MKQKKALVISSIVYLIISIIVILIMFSFIYDYHEDSKYINAKLQCSVFFNAIGGKQVYFGDKLDTPTGKLIESIAKICPSKDVKINKKNIRPAVKLVDDCWEGTGKGVDIMGQWARDVGICVYCGRISSKDNIENFREQFLKELNNEKYSIKENVTGTVSLNNAIFEGGTISNTLNENEFISVFYYIYKPGYPPEGVNVGDFIRDTLVNRLSHFFSSNSIGSQINYYTDSFGAGTLDSYTGIVMTKNIKYNESDFENIRNQIAIRDCIVIVPENNY